MRLVFFIVSISVLFHLGCGRIQPAAVDAKKLHELPPTSSQPMKAEQERVEREQRDSVGIEKKEKVRAQIDELLKDQFEMPRTLLPEEKIVPVTRAAEDRAFEVIELLPLEAPDAHLPTTVVQREIDNPVNHDSPDAHLPTTVVKRVIDNPVNHDSPDAHLPTTVVQRVIDNPVNHDSPDAHLPTTVVKRVIDNPVNHDSPDAHLPTTVVQRVIDNPVNHDSPDTHLPTTVVKRVIDNPVNHDSPDTHLPTTVVKRVIDNPVNHDSPDAYLPTVLPPPAPMQKPHTKFLGTECLALQSVVEKFTKKLNSDSVPIATMSEKSVFYNELLPQAKNAGVRARDAVELMKQHFICAIVPIADSYNRIVAEQRLQILKINAKIAKNEIVTLEEKEWLKQLRVDYRLEEKSSIEDLLARVDIVPLAMIISQAAIESGWGRSRVVLEAKNFFGRHALCGKESSVTSEKKPSVCYKKYQSVEAGISDQIRYLNSSPYTFSKKFRELRSVMRRTGSGQLDSLLLIESLPGYAEDSNYVNLIRELITSNNLLSYERREEQGVFANK